MTEWISVDKRIPEMGETVLAIDTYKKYLVVKRIHIDLKLSYPIWAYDGNEDFEPEYWQPLPKLPEKKCKESFRLLIVEFY